MRQAALLPKPAPLPPAALPPVPGGVLVQAKSGLGGGGALMAPPITDAGRPLDAGTRQAMESGFGRDFGHVRVHDDARAHDNARGLGAKAYAAGDHIVFGEGQYRPETAMGQALIAHELAHTVQQGGVQMKTDGPLPAAADAELEAQADHAAAAVTAGRSAPALSRIGVPAVFRAGEEQPAPAPAAAATTTGLKNVPSWVVGFENDAIPSNAAPLYLGVRMGPPFEMPTEKGVGAQVQAAYDRGGAVSTYYTANSGSSYKEGLGSEGYQTQWLNKYGYTSFKGVSEAILASTDPDVIKVLDAKAGANTKAFDTNRQFVTALASGIKAAGCAVDHIVEKHMGGASVPSNLQLFDHNRNSASGRESWLKVKAHIEELRAPTMRGAKATQLQIFYNKVTVKPGPEDPSHVVETLISTKIKGSDAVKTASEGKPVALLSGPNQAQNNIKDTGETTIDFAAQRVVQGLKLLTYTRKGQGPAHKLDDVTGEFDHKAMQKLGPKQSLVVLKAELQSPGAAPATAANPAPPPGQAATPAAGESRRIAVPAGPQKIPFEYPKLSPGYVTSFEANQDTGLRGAGHIIPSVKFLDRIDFTFGPDEFKMIGKLPIERLNATKPMVLLKSGFRFTSGDLSFDLMDFKPQGTLGFTVGPATKPVLSGTVEAGVEGGAFALTGKIKPEVKIPGISGAGGDVKYVWGQGWSGKVAISGSPFAGANADITLGFNETDKGMEYYGLGGISTTIKGAPLSLTASWAEGKDLVYKGKVVVANPFPFVESATLRGSYSGGLLTLDGSGQIKLGGFTTELFVHYEQLETGKGLFSGSASLEQAGILGGKADIKAKLFYSKQGKLSGHGQIAYQVTKDFRPALDIYLLEDGRIKVKGSVTVSKQLFGEWPAKRQDQERSILKGGLQIDIPVPPMPALQVTLRVTGELGARFKVGPGTLSGTLTAELFPFEENKQLKAKLNGSLKVPATASLYGRFGALLGMQAAMGLVGVEGGIYLIPEIGVTGEGGVTADAEYADGGFSFAAEAYAKGKMFGRFGVDFAAAFTAMRGMVRYEWTYPVAKSDPIDLGPELHVTLGKIAYGRDGTITWPDISQISVTPKELDPLQLVRDIAQKSKSNPAADPGLQDRNLYRQATNPYYMHPGKI